VVRWLQVAGSSCAKAMEDKVFFDIGTNLVLGDGGGRGARGVVVTLNAFASRGGAVLADGHH